MTSLSKVMDKEEGREGGREKARISESHLLIQATTTLLMSNNMTEHVPQERKSRRGPERSLHRRGHSLCCHSQGQL